MALSNDVIVRMVMFGVILILANGCYSLWKKESFSMFLIRTLLFLGMSSLTLFMK
jgi:hypothetical protein